MLITLTLAASIALAPAAAPPTSSCIIQPRAAHCTYENEHRPQHAEHLAANHRNARDMKGWERSMYHGIWFDPTAWDERKCIMLRESHYNYRAKNRTSSASGAYQFLDRQWRDGLVWMMLDESKQTHDGLAPQIKKLRNKPITKWSRYFQDRAFYTAWRFGKGAHHWHHSTIRCY